MKFVCYLEKIIYCIFFILNFAMDDNEIIFITLIFILIYHFGLYDFLEIDMIYSFRYRKKYFSPVNNENKIGKTINIKRKNDKIVLGIFLLFISVSIILTLNGCLNKKLIMLGVCLLLFLNNVFKYDICLIKELLYSSQINCCMDCHINGWDNLLIFSVLGCMILLKDVCLLNKIVVFLIIFLSIIHFILWELNLNYRPERYFPYSNTKLTCANCKKPFCTGTKYYKFKNSEKYKVKNSTSTKDLNIILKLREEHYVFLSLLFAVFCLTVTFFLLGKEFFF